MSHRVLFARVVPFVLGAAALVGCAPASDGASTDTAQSGASDLTLAAAADAGDAGSAQLVIQSAGAPAPFDVGGVVVGSTTVRLLTVTNTGTATSAALSTIALSGAGDFTLVAGPSPCQGVALAPQKTCDVVVAYAPTAVGKADAATLTVSDGKAKATGALKGIGIATGVDYVVSPNPGNLALSPGQSGHVTFTVLNAGTAAGPAITGISTDGDGSYSWWHIGNDHCSKNPGLGVLASCTFEADVTVPAAPSQETGTYFLSVAGAGVVGPNGATYAYAKAVVTLPPAVDYVISPSPGSLSLAPGASGHVTYTVTNKGWQTGPAITAVGIDAISWFQKANDKCTGSAGLASGGACSFDVDVAVPSSATAQTITATLVASAAAAVDPAGDRYVASHLVLTVP